MSTRRTRTASPGRVARLLLPLLAGCAPEPAPAPPAEGWNLLLVTLDTTRPDFLTPYGAPPDATPRLQELAERSAVFERAYSETNVTNPSHVSILSGLRALDHGVTSNTASLPEDVDTLPEAFRRAGYATAAFPAAPHLVEPLRLRGFDAVVRTSAFPDAKEVSRAARAWLRAHADGPFFAWVHFFDPHMPYEPPPGLRERLYPGDPAAGEGAPVRSHPYFARDDAYTRDVARWLGEVRDPAYPRALYAGELQYVDRHLGRLLDHLERLGVEERTVVVVLADHGESLGEHGIFYAHRGLYEEPLRIPLVVHVPGMAARRSDAFATTLDVVPTVRELLGVGPAGPAAGRSLLPALRGDALPAPGAFVHQNALNHAVAVRQGGWKLVWPIAHGVWPFEGGPELFDLSEDPAEQRDLARLRPDEVDALRARAEAWIAAGVQEEGRVSEETLESLRELGYVDD